MPSSDGWVGTWRPHRPRGTIAALYNNPGPKYALPGLTGHSQHDPTRYKAPGFSFGKRIEEPSTDCSPGPRYLIPANMTRAGPDSTPAFSFQSRPKELQVLKVPGPGKYSLEQSDKWLFRSSPAFSIYSRGKDDPISQTPGPAAHTLPPMIGPKVAPSYSIYGRPKNTSLIQQANATPGPAKYNAVDPNTYMRKCPQISMTGRNYLPGDTTVKPGPGAHFPEIVTNTKAKAPSFSFGLRHSQFVCPFIFEPQ